MIGNKERVKCANCGMIYDRLLPDMISDDGSGQCPRCKSNAYDKVKIGEQGQSWFGKEKYE